MRKSSQANALLVEIMLVVLFFCISCTAILELFVVTRQQSDRAAILSHAQYEIQSLSDVLFLADDAEALLSDLGFQKTGESWSRSYENGLDILVSGSWEDTEAGQIRHVGISAVSNGEDLFSLPCDRYFPGEVAP